ncbi:MAG: hypothetical protein ACTHWH_01180 [Marinobacter sp.]
MTSMIPASKTYSGQFRISARDQKPILENCQTLGGVVIEYDRKIPRHEVLDSAGTLVGVVLGILIDPHNAVVKSGSIHLDITESEEDFAAHLEDRIYIYGGSWVMVMRTLTSLRLYLDPCGSLSVVYSQDKAAAGSTAGLLLNDSEYTATFNRELHKELEVLQSGWFPAGMTAHRGINRVLANHYLDLRTWTTTRHWPRRDFVTRLSLEEAGRRIAHILMGTIGAMQSDGPTVLAITGGKDSRLLLAGCRPYLDYIDLVTIDLPGSERDVYLAKSIARIDSQLRHRILGPVLASEEERKLWLYNASHCAGGMNQYYSPSLKPLKSYKYFISGAAGEIGRAFLWRKNDETTSVLDSKGLIARLGLRYNLHLEKEMDKWLEEVGALGFYTVLDLAYLENRVSSWAFSQAYAHVGKGDMNQVSPFNHRELVGILFSLQPDDRQLEKYITEGIRRMWPALLEVPFNRYGSIRDYSELLKAASNPGRLASKLRKLMRGR